MGIRRQHEKDAGQLRNEGCFGLRRTCRGQGARLYPGSMPRTGSGFLGDMDGPPSSPTFQASSTTSGDSIQRPSSGRGFPEVTRTVRPASTEQKAHLLRRMFPALDIAPCRGRTKTASSGFMGVMAFLRPPSGTDFSTTCGSTTRRLSNGHGYPGAFRRAGRELWDPRCRSPHEHPRVPELRCGLGRFPASNLDLGRTWLFLSHTTRRTAQRSLAL